MTCAKTLLMGLRVLVVVVAAAVIGLGAWTKATVHDVEIRGSAVLDTLRLEPASKEDAWRRYVTTVANGTPMVWTSIAAGCVTFLIGTLIILSLKLPRLTMSLNFLAPLEFLSMLAMGGAFGASLSLSLNLDVFEAETRLDASNSPDLMSFAMLIPMSKGYVIATGTGLFLVGTTAISGLVQACHRARESKCCSFEPTVSALGMGHGYQAVVPPPQRTTIPTIYDPRKPAPRDAPASRDEEKGFAGAGASMGRRDSAMSEGNKDDAAVISGPLDLEKPQTVQQMRPSRPWSEMPKKR